MKPPFAPTAIAAMLLLAQHAAHAQDTKAAPKAANELGDVIVTGTRSTTTRVTQSVSPIAVISADALQGTGQRNVIDALTKLEPSLNALARGGDFVNIVRSANLRGLGSNQTLVLVNGKRRHGSAYLATNGVTAGSAAADLDLIPVSAIERIEVLKDGAAAQYGSDAIGGVLNIILKRSASEGQVDLTAGRYADSKINPHDLGNGRTVNASIDKGFKLDDGFLHLSAELRNKQHTNQTGPELRATTVDRYSSALSGDPSVRLGSFGFNAGLPLGGGAEAYAFGTFSKRKAESNQNFRIPGQVSAAADAIYPRGFGPVEAVDESNYSVAVGARGGFWDDARWDASVTAGGDTIDLKLKNSLNNSLLTDTGTSPRKFDIGQFANTQLTANFDLTKPFRLDALPDVLELAAGLEVRHETYGVKSGEAASFYKAGSIAFVGLTPFDAGDHNRDVFGAYLEANTRLQPQWQLGAALRAEKYSDAGSTVTGKLSTRYDFAPSFAVRSTASTGFRAPTLAEQYYSATNVSPTTTSVQLPANSAAAQLAGASELKPEKSRNLSLGIVSAPTKALRLTADAYLIDIRDRIVLASGLRGASPVAAITSRGIVIQTAPGSASVAYFANGIDTRTRGLDLTAQLTSDFDHWGLVKWSLAANFINTKITKAKSAAAWVQLSTGSTLFNPNVRSGLTDASPKSKLIAAADWTLGEWSLGLRITRYGRASLVSPTGSTGAAPYYRSTVNPAWIADVEAAWEPTQKWRFSAGVNNLFNRYPQRVAPQTITPTGAGLLPGFSPYGYNGAYYYLGTSYRF